jgi:phage/plasmid primase-like uncharacterized protein
VLDAKLKIAGLQYIDDAGGKKFLPGTKKKGSFFVIDPNSMRKRTPSTTLKATQQGPVTLRTWASQSWFVSSANNLSPVAETISGYFPKAKHVFIADFDDSKTGEQEAIKAAQVVRRIGAQAEVLMPQARATTTTTPSRVS